MPHKAYGIEWPIYQEPKTKVDGQATAFTLPTRQRAHYWPPEALPFAYVKDCVEIALLRLKEANAAYYEAVKALELPGCQALISDTKTEVFAYASNLQQFTQKVITALQKG